MSSAKQVQSAAPPTALATVPAAAAPAPGNVDKIREIIFGGQMKEYDSRFARLEEALLANLDDLRESTRKRLDSLETSIRKELDSLAEQDKREREDRFEAIKKLSLEVKDSADTLLRKLAEGDTRHSDAQRSIRNDMAAQASLVSDDIQRQARELSASLENRFRELNSAKTDRVALAGMLSEVALRLRGDFDLPEAG